MTFSEPNMNAIETLLIQSMQGVHHLFDNDKIAQILKIPTEELDFFNFDNIDRIQNIFSDFIELESFQEKSNFLNALTEDEYEILVRTYFHIVENSILAAAKHKH